MRRCCLIHLKILLRSGNPLDKRLKLDRCEIGGEFGEREGQPPTGSEGGGGARSCVGAGEAARRAGGRKAGGGGRWQRHSASDAAVGAESEKLGHLGPFGACRNRPDFLGGQPAACKLLKTMKSQVGSRLKSANPGPANAQEAGYGRACQSNESMPPPRHVRFAANSGPAEDQAGCGIADHLRHAQCRGLPAMATARKGILPGRL